MAAVVLQFAFGALSDFPQALRATLTVVLSLMSAWAGYAVIWSGKSLRIDISEHGQIRVAEDKACSVAGRQNGRGPEGASGQEGQIQDAGGTIVRLLPDSTIWPHLLLLRLQAKGQGTRNVLILRDCMNAEHFRILSVACHWIAAHNDQVER